MQSETDQLLVRTRAVLDEWFALVVAALLVLSLIGGWGVYGAIAADQTDQKRTDQSDSWSTTGGFEHRAVVQEENEVFDVGTELTDRRTYFATISPDLEGEFRYTYDASTGDLAVDVRLERVVRAVDEDGDVEHWAVNETLDRTTVEDFEPGEEQVATFSVDVPAVANETERIEESLGASPGTVETVVVAEVTTAGTVDGDPVDRTEVYELEIEPDGEVYHVDGPAAERWTSGGPDPSPNAAAASSAGLLGPTGSALLLVGSFGALVTIGSAKRRGTLAPSERELERLRLSAERDGFDDWISRGSLPSDLHERSRIDVETLEDLVDVAIDCDRRVIEDADVYYVVDGELLYVYEPDSRLDRIPAEDDEESTTTDEDRADEPT